MSFRHAATAAALFALCLWFVAARAKPGSPDQRTDIVPGNFVDVTASSGVQFHHYASQTAKKYMLEIMGSGVALFDFDNDGRLDIFLVNGAPIGDPTPLGTIPRKSDPKYWHRLYHQKPDGTFEDVTEQAGVEGKGYGYGVAVGDYDNDGFEDLFVTEYGGNRLYHNNGNGTFTDVTEKAGVGGSGWSTSAAWVDLDNDGLLDLVVLRYVSKTACAWSMGLCGPTAGPTVFRPSNRWFITTTGTARLPRCLARSDSPSRARVWGLPLRITTAMGTSTAMWPMTPCRGSCTATEAMALLRKLRYWQVWV
ncbi:MAG: VCBS repeat-containing protein [Terriglobia bacterium]